MTSVDGEQLGGAITDQLANLFDEEPRTAPTRNPAALLAPLPTVTPSLAARPARGIVPA